MEIAKEEHVALILKRNLRFMANGVQSEMIIIGNILLMIIIPIIIATHDHEDKVGNHDYKAIIMIMTKTIMILVINCIKL